MEALIALLLQHGVLLVFLVTLAARIGAPVPAGPMLVIAGALAALGQLSLTATVLLSLLANLLGDAVWFVGGRRHGYRVMRLLCRVSLSPDTCVRQSEGLFGRWGGWSLVAAKFVPGVSLVAPPMAGALQMRWRTFVAWDLAGAAVWTAAYLGLGMLFRTEVRAVLQLLADAGTKALIALLVLAAGALVMRVWKRRRQLHDDAVSRLSADALFDALASPEPPQIADVRSALARESAAMLPGAVALDLQDLPRAAAALVPSRPLVVYCNCPNDVTAVRTAARLRRLGFDDVSVLSGGYDAWDEAVRSRAAGGAEAPVVVSGLPGLPAV